MLEAVNAKLVYEMLLRNGRLETAALKKDMRLLAEVSESTSSHSQNRRGLWGVTLHSRSFMIEVDKLLVSGSLAICYKFEPKIWCATELVLNNKNYGTFL